LRDRIVTSAECVTIEVLASTCPETEYPLDVYCAISGGHIEICWAHKKLHEVQCLKMYQFLQYISWLKMY